MHSDHHIFLATLARRELLLVTFIPADGGAWLTHRCAPLDYAPAEADQHHSYHFWDLGPVVADIADPQPGRLVLSPGRLVSLDPAGETFDPADFITWEADWHHPRDWGAYS